MIEPLKTVLRAICEPFFALGDPSKRVFVPFLLGAFVLATVVWAWHLRGRISLIGFLFSPKIWFHKSALLDYKLMVVRALIRIFFLGPFILSVMVVALVISSHLQAMFGDGPARGVNGTFVTVLFTTCAFAAEDFARFCVHYLAHRVPFLWELHKVHHSAEVLTPFSVYRTHPLESVLMRTGAALAVGLTSGLFMWFFSGNISGAEIFGVEALGLLWNLTGSNLRHSNIWLSYGPVLEHIFISPAQHQIHHSNRPEHFRTNCGSVFAVWDWMIGSLYVTRGREKLVFGIPTHERNHGESVVSALVAPVWSGFATLLRPKRKPKATYAQSR